VFDKASKIDNIMNNTHDIDRYHYVYNNCIVENIYDFMRLYGDKGQKDIRAINNEIQDNLTKYNKLLSQAQQ